jgi:aldehyde:ferredoxin oxidoreductase
MAKSHGWIGKVLIIDLTNHKVTKTPTSDFQPEKFLGGTGLNARIFWELGCPKVDPFNPDNPLLISPGPLSGLPGPFNRASASSISPQSFPDPLFTYSSAGGRYPAMLKYAGYDGLCIIGKSEKPVYILIDDSKVTIEDGADLWGVDVYETQRALFDRHPGITSLCCGIAGEKLTRLGAIINETGSAFGQGGFGAVMGSKNLKAIAVRGTGTINVAKPDEFLGLIDFIKAETESSWAVNALRYPVSGWPSASEITDKYRKKHAGCYGCPVQCQGLYDMPGAGKAYGMCASWSWFSLPLPRKEGPLAKDQYDSFVLPQKLGLNVFDLQHTQHFLSNCITEGILRPEDIELPVPGFFGGTATEREYLNALLEGAANNTSVYAQGGPRVGRYLGQKLLDRGKKDKYERLMQLLDNEFISWGQAMHWLCSTVSLLQWAMDTRDPCAASHDDAVAFANFNPLNFDKENRISQHFGLVGGHSTWLGNPANAYSWQLSFLGDMDLTDFHDSTTWDGAPRWDVEKTAAFCINNMHIKNSMTLCDHMGCPDSFFQPPDIDIRTLEARALSSVTGIDYDLERMWEAGEAINNLIRAVMIKREDRTRNDDTINNVAFDKPWQTSVAQAEPLDRAEFEALKDRFYALCGWDVATGWPTRSKLERLGLKEVADDLESIGKLP